MFYAIRPEFRRTHLLPGFGCRNRRLQARRPRPEHFSLAFIHLLMEMRLCVKSRLVSFVFRSILIFTGSLTIAHAETSPRDASCPNRPFDQIQAEFTPPAVPLGEVLIDRSIFWKRVEKLVGANEVFKFTNTKGVEKQVTFHRSLLDGDHRAAIESIFDHWEGTTPTHPKHLALMLGTAYRETCGLISSGVGEACGCKKSCSAPELKGSRYGQRDTCGRAYFGRGLVHLHISKITKN